MPMATKLGRMVTHRARLQHATSQDPLLSGLVRSLTNYNYYISTATLSMTTKFGRIVTNLEGHLSIMLLDLLVKWSCEVK